MVGDSGTRILTALVFALVSWAFGGSAWAHGGDEGTHAMDAFAPCHLLCSVDANRHGASAGSGSGAVAEDDRRVGGRVELAFISPVGRYVDGEWTPLREGAHVYVLQILPSVWVRPVPWLQIDAGMPWEVNEATGVVLPALRPEDGTTREQAPGGIYASASVRLPLPRDLEIEVWTGVGYRMSDPVGTVDLDGSIQSYPFLAIEGLGAGTDDVYLRADARWSPSRLRGWTFGAGAELRVHTLPRMEEHFATTFAGQLVASRSLGERWTISTSVSGFETWLTQLDRVQRNLAIVRSTAMWQSDVGLHFGFGLSAVVPAPLLDENALVYWGSHLVMSGAW